MNDEPSPLPPGDAGAEVALLGSLILAGNHDPTEIAKRVRATGLEVADFYDKRHASVYAAMLDLIDGNGSIDALQLRGVLADRGLLDHVGGSDGLIALTDSVPIAENAPHYARRVRQTAGRRRIMQLTHELSKAAERGDDPDELAKAIASFHLESTAYFQPARADHDLICLADVEPEPIDWLWPNRFALGKISLLAGDPGLGKSFLTLDIAARVTTGKPWPDCPDVAREPGGVVLIGDEDGLADTIRPRADAAGADVSRITILRCPTLDVRRGIQTIANAIEQSPNCKLVVIDPITAYMGEADSHKNADVRQSMALLCALAENKGVAVIAISHLNKSKGGPAVHRVMGSVGFTAVARSAWSVRRDPDDRSARQLVPIKNNIGNDQSGLGFKLADSAVAGVACIHWGDLIEVNPDESFGGDEHDERRTERDFAADFLREFLRYGPKLQSEVFAEAKTHEFSVSTLRRAKKQLGITSGPQVFQGPWYWELDQSQSSPQLPSDDQSQGTGNTGKGGQL